MKIITWNVNSVNTRLPHLLHMLQTVKPDVLMLQEIKCVNEQFPIDAINELGYNVAVSGMKSYNGVALISRFPLEDVSIMFPHDEISTHNEFYTQEGRPNLEARFIEAVISIPNGAYRIASIYVPNGGVSAKEAEMGLGVYETERFKYKEAFYRDLKTHCNKLITQGETLIFGGDYNIAPAEIDVHNPQTCSKNTGFLPKEREILQDFMQEMPDVYRTLNPEDNGFSWWDYRRAGFTANRGMRIDHILLPKSHQQLVREMSVLQEFRAMERPSDHAPVMAVLG
jgi:exodeoxyribonuclease III